MANSTVQFDLTNPQHVAMRKLMADIYARHCEASESKDFNLMVKYEGMAQGLEKVALYVLVDHTLHQLCFDLSCALYAQQECLLEVAA
ncbi:hypothetical protein [Shewanella subflava]|uniref:Uncharacterized protein n=1 Tax=Shewanella subflava TaxID=2986476 RepID=A0ABT3I5C6_9GAMM|nr:hypothetical protein [Shewanella subflava]MCW3171242.1 hypothetical protein [Shewanella subflava]